MIKAFELIRAQTGREEALMRRLIKIPQVRETHLLAGEWDVMATLAFEEQPVDPREHFLNLVTGKIRKMPLVPAMSRMRETQLGRPERRAYAFTFIEARMGHGRDVMDHLMRYDEVAESHLLLGRYDVLAVLQFEKGLAQPVPEKVARIVTDQISRIESIVDTETLCPLESFIKE
jgi:DNA-binding Lrp family transcriptional regulator